MNTTLSIVILHLIIFASQAFYMYFSSKAQMKSRRKLYLVALPYVIAFPLILNYQDPEAYTLYEYSIVFCIIFAAVTDVVYAAVRDKDLMTDSMIRSLHYSYFLICTAAVYSENVSILFRTVISLILLSLILLYILFRKQTIKEFVKAIPLSMLSIACAWAFVTFGL